MKIKNVLLIGVLVLMGSCKSTTSTSNDTDGIEEQTNTISDLQPEISLEDYLRRFSGVSVRGSGPDATILIRSGGNSINMSSEPLFLVNGNQFGGTFSELTGIIAVNDIKSVRVYKNASETAMFGVRGANGVIEILLK
ncbi:TonB-dependent SusC/RagA subfamily outer membrane receptor [Saonia flava]|uniref:TonB-dependent SusC/RagA subfamily outer membrane receptor n=1 Tax=Saonia flava TaxID=523696 RepID=A0A846QXQ4_9FLAO|nr:TonB-dependent receptor plug domain-containing protein [Saonia flava]NJB69884.1 TonB-dependent SusC/RagA subfamily outer membrane receptor [Saonia flava]